MMQSTKGTVLAALLGATMIGGASAHAQSPYSLYFGAGIGSSDIDEGVTVGLISSGSVDGSDTGFKLVGGYRLNPNFAIELSYVDLGTARYSGDYFGSPVVGGRVDVWGLNFGAVGIIPVNPNFSLFGKLGMFGWEADASDITGGFPFSGLQTGTDLSYGLGLEFSLSNTLGLRLEWESFEVVDSDSTLVSFGVLGKF